MSIFRCLSLINSSEVFQKSIYCKYRDVTGSRLLITQLSKAAIVHSICIIIAVIDRGQWQNVNKKQALRLSFLYALAHGSSFQLLSSIMWFSEPCMICIYFGTNDAYNLSFAEKHAFILSSLKIFLYCFARTLGLYLLICTYTINLWAKIKIYRLKYSRIVCLNQNYRLRYSRIVEIIASDTCNDKVNRILSIPSVEKL